MTRVSEGVKLIPLLAIFVVINGSTAFADYNNYLCVADQAIGYRFDPALHAWSNAVFYLEGDKYTIRKENEGWVWEQFGGKLIPARCGEFDEYGISLCGSDNHIYNVIFNRKALRFEMTYFGEYAEHLKADESKSDTPYIEIGTCTPIS